ncbi:MAG: UDP-N-acetylglucosamine pyrophosphorylase [Coriobacteriia bacterium]
MDLHLECSDKVAQLMSKGVRIPNPLSLEVAHDVDINRISGDGVTIAPGCRIQGSGTVISSGCHLGAEGPATLVDCRLGPNVELKGGYFKESVFLEGASVGPGAHVREACLIEEGASGAHCVGLKQTVLFPYVTLGSLINFCDCLMAGGTSRTDHSEVGSSYVHFNYTPEGDKTTASLFGDVPRGVMLDQSPIFLGGQGGAVGPVRVGYGTVVAAGSILRHDVVEDGRLIAVDPVPGLNRERRQYSYRDLSRVVRNNIIFLANMVALEQWYQTVRQPFFAKQELGELVYEGALEVLHTSKQERIKRLKAMAGKVPSTTIQRQEFAQRIHAACDLFDGQDQDLNDAGFLGELHALDHPDNYLETIQSLSPEMRARGTHWLQHTVDSLCAKTNAILLSMNLFDDERS